MSKQLIYLGLTAGPILCRSLTYHNTILECVYRPSSSQAHFPQFPQMLGVGMVFRDTWARAPTRQAFIPEAIIKAY